MTNIKDLPRHERPREKMIERGPTGLKDKELIRRTLDEEAHLALLNLRVEASWAVPSAVEDRETAAIQSH